MRKAVSAASRPVAMRMARDLDLDRWLDTRVRRLSLGTLLVGFAAETGDADGDPLAHARAKLAGKGVDLLVLNDVAGGAVFGQADNAVLLLTPDGSVEGPHTGSKAAVAHAVWDKVVGLSASTV